VLDTILSVFASEDTSSRWVDIALAVVIITPDRISPLNPNASNLMTFLL
jgi:hypothetical protein